MQRAHFSLYPLGAVAVALVDDENVGNLHDASLNRLHIIAHTRDQDDDCNIGKTHDINLVLPNTDRLNHDQVTASSVEYCCHIRGRARKPA